MIDRDQARERALTLARQTAGRDVEIQDERTIERDFGWVFFYDSSEYLATGESRWKLFGNAPIIIDRDTGGATPTGTAFPVDAYVAAYETLGTERFASDELLRFLKATRTKKGRGTK